MQPLLRAFAKPPVILSTIAIVAVAAVGITYISTSRTPTASYVTPTMGPLTQEVDSTGDVKAADSLDLGFQIGGRISYAGPAVGTHVDQGTTLATLSSADLAASVEQAKAALAVQQANLDALNAGARPEDIAVAQTAVTGAQTSVTQEKQSLVAVAQDAYAKADDAIHNRVDQLFTNPRTAAPTLNITMSDEGLQNEMVSGRVTMETLLTSWQQFVQALPQDPDQIDAASLVSTTRANLQQVGSYLDTVAAGLTAVVPTTSYPLSTIQGYQTNIATARTNISADLTTLDAAETGETSAESGLASAQSALALAQASSTPQALEAQQAQVAEAQANVDAAQAQLGNTVISAPISGTITVNNAEVGEIAAPGTPEISMISDTQFQFETYISEADLAKVQVGQEAQVELDAYQDQAPFPAHVVAIDPAATVQSGVSSYKVTLQFDQSDPRVQAGLTGSVKIISASESNVLSVPTSAIITRGTDHFVIIKSPSENTEVQVTTGISSADGYTEITSGLSANDQVESFGVEPQ